MIKGIYGKSLERTKANNILCRTYLPWNEVVLLQQVAGFKT